MWLFLSDRARERTHGAAGQMTQGRHVSREGKQQNRETFAGPKKRESGKVGGDESKGGPDRKPGGSRAAWLRGWGREGVVSAESQGRGWHGSDQGCPGPKGLRFALTLETVVCTSKIGHPLNQQLPAFFTSNPVSHFTGWPRRHASLHTESIKKKPLRTVFTFARCHVLCYFPCGSLPFLKTASAVHWIDFM